MPARSTAERALIGRIAAAERWSRLSSPTDRSAATTAAREGLRAKFLREADPDGTMPEAERERAADLLMKAHMARMQLRARQAKRRKAAARACG